MKRVQIRVRQVTRYQVVRSYEDRDERSAGAEAHELFDTEAVANLVADALRAKDVADGAEIVDELYPAVSADS